VSVGFFEILHCSILSAAFLCVVCECERIEFNDVKFLSFVFDSKRKNKEKWLLLRYEYNVWNGFYRSVSNNEVLQDKYEFVLMSSERSNNN
jgi:hypothetical protein